MRVQSRCIWRLPCNSELQRSSAAGHVCLRFSTTRPHRNSQAVEMERLVSAKMRLQCRAARKPRAASCLAAAQRMATTDNRPQASTSKGAASSKRKSTPQCHTQRAASALNIKAASQGGPRINHPPRSLHWAYTATPGGDHLHSTIFMVLLPAIHLPDSSHDQPFT